MPRRDVSLLDRAKADLQVAGYILENNGADDVVIEMAAYGRFD